MENTHKRTFRVVSNITKKYHKDLLSDDSNHQKHLQFSVTEAFKSTNKLDPEFLPYSFEKHEISFNLSCGSVIILPGTNTRKCKINSLNFIDEMLWNMITKNIKLSKALPEFKRLVPIHNVISFALNKTLIKLTLLITVCDSNLKAVLKAHNSNLAIARF